MGSSIIDFIKLAFSTKFRNHARYYNKVYTCIMPQSRCDFDGFVLDVAGTKV